MASQMVVRTARSLTVDPLYRHRDNLTRSPSLICGTPWHSVQLHSYCPEPLATADAPPVWGIPVTRVSNRYAEVQVCRLTKVSTPARTELTHGHWLLRPWLWNTCGNRNACTNTVILNTLFYATNTIWLRRTIEGRGQIPLCGFSL